MSEAKKKKLYYKGKEKKAEVVEKKPVPKPVEKTPKKKK